MRVLKKELWPHCVTLDIEETHEIEIWLGETLGCFKDRWNAVYKSNRTDFYFRQGKDATMFALRWS
jgi:hypothetical protein